MKKYIKSISARAKTIALLAGLGLTATMSMAQQMSGTVYIDANGTASSTVFKNWYSFWRSMQGLSRTDGGPNFTVAPFGVNGPLTVEVMTTNTVAETVAMDLPATIGSDVNDKITINGNGYELWYSGTNAAIRFTGANHVTIDNLTIRNSNSTPGGIWFNNQSDSNTISNCRIFLSNLTSANSSVYYISMSTSVTSPTSVGSAATGTTGMPGRENTITGCRFYTQSGSPGPYYGVTLNGTSNNYSSVPQNNSLLNCVIENFNYGAVWMGYTNGNVVKGNDISRSNATTGGQTTLYGIYNNYAYCTNRSTEISGNNIHDLPFAGASTSNTNLSTFYGTYNYYIYGNNTNKFVMDGNTVKNVFYTTGSRYVHYVYYPEYIDVMNNIIDNVDGTSTSSTAYDWYIYYPTAVRCNYNTCTNSETRGYLYNFYIYYSTDGVYTWQEFIGNNITNNTSVNYLYSVYIYYYRGNTDWKVINNYVVNNNVTGTSGYFYFYLYYFHNYEVLGNVVAGNRANSQYHYVYSGLSGSYTAEIRNNTFEADMAGVPTPGSSYLYGYFYLYYHTVRFTGNIFDYKGGSGNYYRYMYMYLSYSNPSNLLEFDYNTYSLNNNFTYPYWYFNGSNYTDWAGFSGAGNNGPNDNGVDPLFLDKPNKDFRPGAWAVQNNVPYNSKNPLDALSVSRNKTRHDRGGLENMTDLEAVATNFTVADTVCAGYSTGATNITLKSNYIYDLATNFNVSFAVNGGPKVSAKVTKKLAAGDTAMVWFPKSLTLNDYGANRVAIFIDLPDDDNSNDSFIFTTFVKPAPGGGKFTFSSKPTQAFYQYTKSNDVTVLSQPVFYNSVSPRIYNNGQYGTKWVASAYAKTVGGNLRPSSEVTYTAPSGGNDLEVKFQTADANMEDSIILVCLKVTDLTNGCDTLICRQVLIYPTVNIAFTFPSSICDGDAIQFENQSKVRSGSMEFLWDFGTGKTADQTETPEPVFTYATSGTYTVKLMAKTLPYGFPSEKTATVVVKVKPKATYTHTNACAGTALTFNSTGTTSGTSLLWTFGDNTSSTQANPTKKYNLAGGYMVSLKATNSGGCSDVMTKRVYQHDMPKASWSKTTGSCDNDVFNFTNSSTIAKGNVGSFWDFNDGTVSAEYNPEHVFTSAGKKNVKLTAVSEFGCKDDSIQEINLKESPKTSFTYTPACSLTPTEFTNTTPSVANGIVTKFDWTFSDGASSLLENPTHQWSSVGPKTITLKINLDNGCSSSSTQNLVVGVEPDADFSAANVCAGQPVVLENKTKWEEGNISYEWSFGDNTFSTERAPNKVYSVNVTTTYTVTLTAKIANGCTDVTSKQVTINEGPKTCDFSSDIDYASSYYGVKLSAIDGSGQVFNQPGVTYTWVIQGQGNKSGAVVNHDLKKDGSYEVTMRARVDATDCECTKTKTVVMNRTAVEDLEKVGVALYPNPNAGNFNIALTENFGANVKVEILTLTGAKVKEVSTMNNGLIQIEGSEMMNGVYLVRISSGEKMVTKKITVQK